MQYKNKKTIEEEIREKGASIIHDVWSHWQNYLHSKGKTISDENWERWERQLRTSYNLLSEEEKESDRQIFDKFYADFIHQIRQDDLNAIKEMIEKEQSGIKNKKTNSFSEGYWWACKQILQELDNLNKE